MLQKRIWLLIMLLLLLGASQIRLNKVQAQNVGTASVCGDVFQPTWGWPPSEFGSPNEAVFSSGCNSGTPSFSDFWLTFTDNNYAPLDPSCYQLDLNWEGAASNFRIKILNPTSCKPIKSVHARQECKCNPAILVHGWLGAADYSSSCNQGITLFDPMNMDQVAQSFYEVADRLKNSGYSVYIAHLTSGKSGTPPIATNAQCLKNQIAQVASPTNKAVVIAHSMGGLVTRAYAESSLYSGNKNISTIITLGSPHQGVPYKWFAWLLNARGINPATQKALDEMYTDGPIKQFNKLYAERADEVKYYLVNGDLPQSMAKSYAKVAGKIVPGADDGFVGVSSGENAQLAGIWQRHTTWTEAHSIGLGDASYFASVAPGLPPISYFECIEPVLVDHDASGCKDVSAASSHVEAADVAYNAFTPAERQAGTAWADHTKTIFVDNTGPAMFVAEWDMGSISSFYVVSPGGQTVDSVYAASHPTEVVYDESEGFATYEFMGAQAGNWTLHFTPAENTEYSLSAMMQSAVSVSVQTDKQWYAVGEQATISAQVNAPVAPGVLEARLTLPNSTTTTLTLSAVGGGLYQVQFTTPFLPGFVNGTLHMSGVDGGGNPYERDEPLGFQIGSNGASLTNSYNDHGQDTNGNGKFEYLLVNVGVNVTTAGTYSVAADLVAPDGTVVDHASITTQLNAGNQTLQLMFDGKTINVSKKNGPYKLRSLFLLDSTNALLPIKEVAEAYTTGNYTAEQFDTGSTSIFLPIILK